MELAFDALANLEEAEREGRTLPEQAAAVLSRGVAQEILVQVGRGMVLAMEGEKLARKFREAARGGALEAGACPRCQGKGDFHSLADEEGLCLKCCPKCSQVAQEAGVGVCRKCGRPELLERLDVEGVHPGGCSMAGRGAN